jgi:hypothetical protein
MSTVLVNLISSVEYATRNQSLDDYCRDATFEQHLAECGALDAFRLHCENL